jgi:hypothetical protein
MQLRIGRMVMVLACSVAVMTVSAQAMPLANSAGALKSTVDDSDLIQRVDACNRACRKGPVEEWGNAVRWHRHVGSSCRPVSCTPR